jgi:lysozyme
MKLSQIAEEVLNEGKVNFFDGSTMSVSKNFWNLIREEEGDPKKRVSGIKQPVLVAYKDSVGVLTIGYGHTGSDVKPGLKITPKKAMDLLKKDVKIASDCVRRIMSEWKSKKIKSYMITQGQFDAMVSLVFNAGCDAVRTSQFIQKLKYKKYRDAAVLIKSFRSTGLTSRREKESKLFMTA